MSVSFLSHFFLLDGICRARLLLQTESSLKFTFHVHRDSQLKYSKAVELHSHASVHYKLKSDSKMEPNAPPSVNLYCHFVVSLLFLLATTSDADFRDISCVKSIKESLEDPLNYLNSSWNFNNNTEGFICGFIGIECWHPEENRVLNIRLSDMGLKGPFPSGISNCTSLTGLDLSSNELYGPIPSDISRLTHFLTSLDLSYNNFSGEIPPDISNCAFLNTLKLDHNQLTGTIPPEIGLYPRIWNFSVANNLLQGPVPNFGNATFQSDSYANNSGLCGEPLDPCERKKHKFFNSFKEGFLVGYGIFFVSVSTIFMSSFFPSILALFELMRRKRNQTDEDQVKSTINSLCPELLHEHSEETSLLVKVVSKMSYIDLGEATNSFCDENLIGVGSMGMTYKATLANGWELAVKRLSKTPHFEDYFVTELKTLGRFRHQSLLPLLGFCIDSEERLLVYRYLSNGNLYDFLHPASDQTKPLPWPLRVKIATGIARGMLWLHHTCSPRIAHLDISAKCILLDEDFEPKISNFGEAVVLRSDGTDSTWSFSAESEFWKSGLIKEDVYSFGILLLELLTGEDSTGITSSGHNNLHQWVMNLSSSSDLDRVIDKSLVGQGFDLDILEVLTLAYDCANPFQDRRPTMAEVYGTISRVGKICGLKFGNSCKDAEIKEI